MPLQIFRRTILITGATDGVGKQTATDLASHPDNFVIIHGADQHKCEATRDTIVKETGNDSNIEFVVADLSILAEVAEMADSVRKRFPLLNLLMCNAALLNTRRVETKDGLELTFQVNYLAHFLLCNRLLDVLSRNRCPRIVVIGSVLHNWSSLDWQDMQAEKEYEKYSQFSKSKLMCHMMAFTLHRRMQLGEHNVTVNVIELGKEKEPNNNGKLRTTSALSSSMSALSVCRTADNLVQYLENSAFDKVSGKYVDPTGKQIRSGSEATDERLQERLWTYSTELCGQYINSY